MIDTASASRPTAALCSLDIPVTFGDCDPAGIVFYPNFYRWMDTTFHHFLRGAGGHAQIARSLGSKGLGVLTSELTFRAPAKDGDLLNFALTGIEWGERSFLLQYSGRSGAVLCCEGSERRAVFVTRDDRMGATATGPLREMLSPILSHNLPTT
ncbi:hypothetical protein ADU59_00655 (plasmid) [Pararhizobium polonicum]|uniref:Uncharacterized protein n=1 Tax=Pararhizobium polonicum TaxID=1612624 RepID=A0A1C7P8Q3_9HYPH|nr:acyl-CoA thioesterase [Pararhizobium polonicum]OBZ97557.1 hypothetical protein ADU59_00655 [Pararhizobium polonicum]